MILLNLPDGHRWDSHPPEFTIGMLRILGEVHIVDDGKVVLRSITATAYPNDRERESKLE